MVVNQLSDAKGFSPIEVNTIFDRLKNMLSGVNASKSVYNGDDSKDIESNSATNGDPEMGLEELTAQVETLQDTVKTMQANQADALKAAFTDAIKPIADKLATIETNSAAVEAKEKAALVAKVVEANLLTETIAETLDVNALRELAPKTELQGAPVMFGGQMQVNEDDQWKDYDLNANMGAK